MLAFDLKACFSVLQFETNLDTPVILCVFYPRIQQYSLRFCQPLFFQLIKQNPAKSGVHLHSCSDIGWVTSLPDASSAEQQSHSGRSVVQKKMPRGENVVFAGFEQKHSFWVTLILLVTSVTAFWYLRTRRSRAVQREAPLLQRMKLQPLFTWYLPFAASVPGEFSCVLATDWVYLQHAWGEMNSELVLQKE